MVPMVNVISHLVEVAVAFATQIGPHTAPAKHSQAMKLLSSLDATGKLETLGAIFVQDLVNLTTSYRSLVSGNSFLGVGLQREQLEQAAKWQQAQLRNKLVSFCAILTSVAKSHDATIEPALLSVRADSNEAQKYIERVITKMQSL